MRLVVDANIIIAALLGSRKTIHIIVSERYTLYAPAILLEEIRKHKELLSQRTGKTFSSLDNDLQAILFFIHIVSSEKYSTYRERVKLRDNDDIDYIAYAIACKAAVWSNDKDLHDQKLVPAFTTQMLFF